MSLILGYETLGRQALTRGVAVRGTLAHLPAREEIGRAKICRRRALWQRRL